MQLIKTRGKNRKYVRIHTFFAYSIVGNKYKVILINIQTNSIKVTNKLKI